MPHPNYAAVALETLALPFAFHAWTTLVVGGAINLVALARRIRREERALGDNERPPGGVGGLA